MKGFFANKIYSTKQDSTVYQTRVSLFPFPLLLIVKFTVVMEQEGRDCIHEASVVHFLTYAWLCITLNMNAKDALYFSINCYSSLCYVLIEKSIQPIAV